MHHLFYGKDLLGLGEGQITAWLMSAVASASAYRQLRRRKTIRQQDRIRPHPARLARHDVDWRVPRPPEPHHRGTIVALPLRIFCGFFIVPVTA